MKALRKNDIPCHFEKTDGKLTDDFSVFKGRLNPAKGKNGNPNDSGEEEEDAKPKEDKPDFDAEVSVGNNMVNYTNLSDYVAAEGWILFQLSSQ